VHVNTDRIDQMNYFILGESHSTFMLG